MESRPSTKSQENVRRSPGRRLRFDAYEVDFDQRELRRDGQRVNLQQKPFQVLELLLEHPGELVSRGELARHLWPDLHVDFDRSLNTAVNVLRQALNDAPHASRFVETRPGLGYRFVAKVEIVDRIPEKLPITSREELAESVMAAVAGALNLPHRRPSPRPARPIAFNREAYADYRRGKFFLDRCSEQDLIRSQACFEAAIEQDPASALAYSGLAEVYSSLAFLAAIPANEGYARAGELARYAVQLDSRCSEAVSALGAVKFLFEWDWPGAEAMFLRALELDGENARARQAYANLLAATGRGNAALEEALRAREAEPLSFTANLEVSRLHYLAGKWEEAASYAWSALALEPKLAHAQHLLGLAYEQLHMFEEAITEFENSLVCFGNRAFLTTAIGHAWAQAGHHANARSKVHELETLASAQYVPHFASSVLHAGLGEHERALEALEQSLTKREVWLPWAAAEPRLAPLRSSDRFQQLLRSLQMPRRQS